MRALKAEGAQVGILSNTDVDLWALLERLALDRLVDAAIPCFLHGVEKPEPEAFALAVEALGAQAQDVWFVGDSLHHDVLPAAEAGMRPVLVDRLGVHAPSGEYVKVSDLKELPDVLAERRP